MTCVARSGAAKALIRHFRGASLRMRTSRRWFLFFSSRRRHTRCGREWSSDVCSSDLPEIGGRLRAVRVLNISLGVDREGVSGAHWIYFPEPGYSFYRVGFPANLSAGLAPRGCTSLYVERSLLRDESFDAEEAIATAVEDLRRAGILWKGD